MFTPIPIATVAKTTRILQTSVAVSCQEFHLLLRLSVVHGTAQTGSFRVFVHAYRKETPLKGTVRNNLKAYPHHFKGK